MKRVPAGAAAALLLAALLGAGPAPSDPVALLSLTGKSVAGLTFVPLDGAPRALAAPGRATVVVLFASWCTPCMQEMPRTVAESERFRDRVDFLGIDYTDSPGVARKLIARFRIPFPVESYIPDQTEPARQTVHLPDTFTAAQLQALRNRLPADTYDRVADVYAARATMTPEHFRAYEKWKGVFFEDPKQLAAERATADRPSMVGLPHTFVIDAHGVLRYALEGYTPSRDRVAQALKNLGY